MGDDVPVQVRQALVVPQRLGQLHHRAVSARVGRGHQSTDEVVVVEPHPGRRLRALGQLIRLRIVETLTERPALGDVVVEKPVERGLPVGCGQVLGAGVRRGPGVLGRRPGRG